MLNTMMKKSKKSFNNIFNFFLGSRLQIVLYVETHWNNKKTFAFVFCRSI